MSGYESDSCGRSYTIRIRYVWTQIFLYPHKKICGYKNLRISVDGASIYHNQERIKGTEKVSPIHTETAKSVKSLGLKDNSTNQIRMKIYSEHIQTARVETKTVKE